MTIAVIDGQGGRVGALLIEAMRKVGIGEPHRILALGANALATSAMLRAGADQGATGANAVLFACRSADLIAGPIGIVMADAMLGEITPAMALAVGRSAATKLLLPMNQCSSIVAGTQQMTLSQLIDSAVSQVQRMCAQEQRA